MKTLTFLTIVLISQNLLAMDKEDAFESLRQAVMESNKDYMESREKIMDGQQRRIASWDSGEKSIIEIPATIEIDSEEDLEISN